MKDSTIVIFGAAALAGSITLGMGVSHAASLLLFPASNGSQHLESIGYTDVQGGALTNGFSSACQGRVPSRTYTAQHPDTQGTVERIVCYAASPAPLTVLKR